MKCKLLNCIWNRFRDIMEHGISSRVARDRAIFYNNEGHKLYMQVKFDEAVALYTKGIEFDNTLGVLYYNRGTIHYRMGCFEEAYKDLLKSVELDPSNEDFKTGLQQCRSKVP